MKKIFLGIVIAFAMIGAFLVGRISVQDHTLTRASATYLFSETEVKDAKGKALSRAELLDLILRDAVMKAK